MKLSKTMGEALSELFGPNSTKWTHVTTTDILRFRAFQELERWGLVQITDKDNTGTHTYKTLRVVTRTMDQEKTLCEVFQRECRVCGKPASDNSFVCQEHQPTH